jgi:hypothetical protein
MEIRDVIGNMREDIRVLKHDMSSLRSYVDTLERFTWNMIQLLSEGHTEIVITLEVPDGVSSYQPSTSDSQSASEARVGTQYPLPGIDSDR